MYAQKRAIERSHLSYFFWKRVCDLVLSVPLLLLLVIPMALIALAIRLTSTGPVIFRQERIGRNGAPFLCYKFRTMYRFAPPDCPTAKLEHAERLITPLGRLLRRTSLDELPQLWNVLNGTMSLVGPRPLIANEEEVHKLRHTYGVYRLRPGITGLAQIHGRDLLSDKEKFSLDLRYLHTVGFRTDLHILRKTVFRLLTGDGICEGVKSKTSI